MVCYNKGGGTMNPWDAPEIQMVLSIMDCMVVNVKQVNIVQVEDSDYEDIQR